MRAPRTILVPGALRLSRTRFSPVGIELDGDVARAAQFALRGRDARLHAAAEVRLPRCDTPVERAEVLRGVLKRRGFLGDRVSLCAPARALDSDLIDLSESRNTPPEEAVRATFARATRCAPTAMEVSFWHRRTDDTDAAYAVALRHTEAARLIAPFEDAGLDVVHLACPASASAALLAALDARSLLPPTAQRRNPACTALLRLGVDGHLVLLLQGSDVIYQRTLDAGGWSSVLPPTASPLDPASLTADRDAVQRHLADVVAETASTLECVPRTFGRLDVGRLLVAGLHAPAPSVAHALAQLRCAAVAAPALLDRCPGAPLPPEGADVAAGAALAATYSEVTR